MRCPYALFHVARRRSAAITSAVRPACVALPRTAHQVDRARGVAVFAAMRAGIGEAPHGGLEARAFGELDTEPLVEAADVGPGKGECGHHVAFPVSASCAVMSAAIAWA